METMRTYYGLINDGDTAIIEVASCAGLDIVKNHKNPLLTTTFGVGQQLLAHFFPVLNLVYTPPGIFV